MFSNSIATGLISAAVVVLGLTVIAFIVRKRNEAALKKFEREAAIEAVRLKREAERAEQEKGSATAEHADEVSASEGGPAKNILHIATTGGAASTHKSVGNVESGGVASSLKFLGSGKPSKLQNQNIAEETMRITKAREYVVNGKRVSLGNHDVAHVYVLSPEKTDVFLDDTDGFLKNKAYLLSGIRYRYHTIVLGAWGCGVFGNPTEEIAEAFHRLLIEEGLGDHFDTVVFAVYRDEKKLSVFRKTFKDVAE